MPYIHLSRLNHLYWVKHHYSDICERLSGSIHTKISLTGIKLSLSNLVIFAYYCMNAAFLLSNVNGSMKTSWRDIIQNNISSVVLFSQRCIYLSNVLSLLSSLFYIIIQTTNTPNLRSIWRPVKIAKWENNMNINCLLNNLVSGIKWCKSLLTFDRDSWFILGLLSLQFTKHFVLMTLSRL